MNEVYEEWLVKRKTPGKFLFFLPLAVVGAIIVMFLCVTMVPFVGYIVGLLPFVGVYYLYQYSKIEYEYTYVTGELVIDKIINQNRRKNIVTLEMSNVETVAALDGHFLDGQMGNSEIPKLDYSSGEQGRKLFGVLAKDKGQTKIFIIEPNAKIIDGIRKNYPRKVQM